jgi:hypothetical protein
MPGSLRRRVQAVDLIPQLASTLSTSSHCSAAGVLRGESRPELFIRTGIIGPSLSSASPYRERAPPVYDTLPTQSIAPSRALQRCVGLQNWSALVKNNDTDFSLNPKKNLETIPLEGR